MGRRQNILTDKQSHFGNETLSLEVDTLHHWSEKKNEVLKPKFTLMLRFQTQKIYDNVTFLNANKRKIEKRAFYLMMLMASSLPVMALLLCQWKESIMVIGRGALKIIVFVIRSKTYFSNEHQSNGLHQSSFSLAPHIHFFSSCPPFWQEHFTIVTIFQK